LGVVALGGWSSRGSIGRGGALGGALGVVALGGGALGGSFGRVKR